MRTIIVRLASVVILSLLFTLPALAQQCSRLQFMEVDSNKVYRPGQKIKYDEPHGVYTGLLSVDTAYFFCPIKLTVKKRGSTAPHETYEGGTISLYMRSATVRQWSKKILDYRCEDLALNPGKMELAVFNGKELQVGSHDALCTFSEQK